MKILSKAALTACILIMSGVTHSADEPRPDVSHSAADVVAIVIDALKRNPRTSDDSGIETVWAFASPRNRSFTGPLDRFSAMIKSSFSDMLGFAGSRFDDIQVNGDSAAQSVWLLQADGREVGYLFQLKRQTDGEFSGMWMTDGVAPLGESGRGGTSI